MKNKCLLLNAQKFYRRFLSLRGEPRQIALGFALGLFIGVTPSIGFQMVIAATTAAFLKWNKFSAAIGVWITNPLTAPFIYSFTYLLGSKIYGINKIYNPPDEMTISIVRKILLNSPGIFYSLTIGGIAIGVPLAIAGYFISYSLLARYQESLKGRMTRQKEKLKTKMERIKQKVRPVRRRRHDQK